MSHRIAYLVLAVGMVAGLYLVQQSAERGQDREVERVTEALYRNAIASCERGNLLRQVVYSNTKQAASIDPNASYQGQLKILQSVPGTDPETGTVNCRAIIPRP
jgi:hypothetical protein